MADEALNIMYFQGHLLLYHEKTVRSFHNVTHYKGPHNFLLARHCNYGPILHRV